MEAKFTQMSIDINGKVPEGNEVAIVAFADSQSDVVRSIGCPIFKCSGVVPTKEGKLARDLIQKHSPSLAPLVLRKTNRWFRLPLKQCDDDLEHEGPTIDEDVDEILKRYVKEHEDNEQRIQRSRNEIREKSSFVVTDELIDRLVKPESAAAETEKKEEEEEVTKEEKVIEVVEKKEEEEEELTEEQAQQREFEQQIVEMMQAENVKKLDVLEAVDKLRPGRAKNQSWFVMYHLECETGGGGAVAILAGFEDEQIAAEYCQHKNQEFPFVNVTYGPIGQFMPMPPSDFSEERVHQDPRVAEMRGRLKENKAIFV